MDNAKFDKTLYKKLNKNFKINYNNLNSFFIILCYYTYGNFGFLNLLDLRTEFQILLFILVCTLFFIKKSYPKIPIDTYFLYIFIIIFFGGSFICEYQVLLFCCTFL